MNINQVWPEWYEDCVLGEGSFGKVYRAKRVEYGRTFYSAIKVLTVPKSQQEIKFARSQGMNDSEIYDYFRGLVDNLLNEITLMDNLKGAQNIVGIEDYKIIERQGEIGWDIFIRMELLTPFDSFVSNPEFSQTDVIRLGVDICTALEVCEQNYIVHRDIKPDNIFISRFGEYKLGDFGIARKLEATQANLSRKGTLNYMAPEVYKSEEYGSNVDLYSLGLVLYTLLNNNRIAFLPPYPQPITYKDNEEALAKRLSGMPVPPPCNASPALGALIVKACAYNPADRFASATEFKNALIQEWNALVQSGQNAGIYAGTSQYDATVGNRLENTTNDMTLQGRLLVDAYAQDTTVLESGSGAVVVDGGDPALAAAVVPESYSTSRSSKLCRILAWPLQLAVAVMAIVLMASDSLSAVDKASAWTLLGIGLSVLIAQHNKYAVGVCAVALSFGYVVEGLTGLVGDLQQTLPFAALVILLSGLLMLCGGIVILSQKEVRFGGSLCLYASAVEWCYLIYQLLNNNFSVTFGHIICTVAAVGVFMWSYGYRSDLPIRGIRIPTYIATCVLAAFVCVRSLIFLITSLTTIF